MSRDTGLSGGAGGDCRDSDSGGRNGSLEMTLEVGTVMEAAEVMGRQAEALEMDWG